MANAYAPTNILMTSLNRAGGGPLAGHAMRGARYTLSALVDQLPFKSGEGKVTVPQVADTSGYSIRWTRIAMQELEAAGIITWTRGGVVAGKQVPSYVRISKKALVEMIRQARPVLAAILAERAKRTAARIAGLRYTLGRRRRRSVQGEVTSGLSSLTGSDSPPGSGGGGGECAHGEVRGARYCALCRRGLLDPTLSATILHSGA